MAVEAKSAGPTLPPGETQHPATTSPNSAALAPRKLQGLPRPTGYYAMVSAVNCWSMTKERAGRRPGSG
jgi:hypothetical protein